MGLWDRGMGLLDKGLGLGSIAHTSCPFATLPLVRTAPLLTRPPLVFALLQNEFYSVCHTKADYMEHGPSIARHNAVFGSIQ